MVWFEVRPASKEWVVNTKNFTSEDKFRFITSEANKIHAEAESFLDRFIRNYKLALAEAVAEPDRSCVRELMDEAVSFKVLFVPFVGFFLFLLHFIAELLLVSMTYFRNLLMSVINFLKCK